MTADLIAGWDAATCPDPLPRDGIGVACEVYIGGSSAFHVWTDREINRVRHMPKLPVWVPTPGSDNPRQAALACVARLHELGVPASRTGKRVRVLCDLETGQEPDAPWLDTFALNIWARGYSTSPYMSLSLWDRSAYTAKEGVVIAEYPANGEPNLALFDDKRIVGHQYAAEVHTAGGNVDLDLFRPDFVEHFWM